MKRFLIIIIALFVHSISAYSQKKSSFDENKLQINWELIANNYNKEEKVLTSLQFINTEKPFSQLRDGQFILTTVAKLLRFQVRHILLLHT